MCIRDSYTAYYVITIAGQSFVVGIIAAIIVVFMLGSLVERVLLSPVRIKGKVENPMEYSLIVTFALSILLQKVAVILFGTEYRRPSDYFSGNIDILKGIQIPANLLFATVVSLLLIILLSLYLGKSWRGRGWRSIAQNLDGAAVTGVPIGRESTVVFGVSTALAASAGEMCIRDRYC